MTMVFLYVLSGINYNLFHLTVEFFAIYIAITIFLIAWNSREFSENDFFVFIGISFLFIGILDAIHTLSYKDMNLFLPLGLSGNLAAQFWMVTRYLHSVSILLSIFFIKWKLRMKTTFLAYGVYTVLFTVLIFMEMFPICFIEGTGLTPFKIISEYVIIGILVLAIGLLYVRRAEFESNFRFFIVLAIIFMIASEFSFTLYTDVTGLANVIGHYLKIISFYWVYKALIENSLKKPYQTLFRNLKLSERRLLEERNALAFSKEQIETIITTVPDGILFLDQNGEVFLINSTFNDIYKSIYQQGVPSQKNLFQCAENRLCDTIKEIFLAQEAQTRIIEAENGKYYQINASLTPFTRESPKGFLFIIHDVTEFMELEKMRTQIISTVSHELRTPLTVIDLSVKNLLNYKERLSEEAKNSIVKRISNNSDILIRMVEDLLVASRIDEKKLQLDWQDYSPDEVFQQILIQMEPRKAEKEITVSYDINPNITLFGDPQRIGQLFRIIIDNSIKYSRNGGEVEIRAVDHYQGDLNLNASDGTLFQIRDYGIGIKEREIPNLFGRFYRAKDVGSIPGSGLGLAIAREMARLHGGEIFVESKYGEGSTFSVFLPRLTDPIK